MRALIRILKKFLISTLFLGVVWAAGLYQFVQLIPTQPQLSNQRVDAAIVLTGGAMRVEHGLAVVSSGKAREVFITGVNDDATPEHVIAAATSQADMPNQDNITLGYKARSTIGNSLEVKQWIESHNIHSIRIVTANYHMPRSLLEFHFMLPESMLMIADPVFPDGFDISRWVSDSNSRRLVMSEYHKYLAATLRHWLVRWQQL